MKSASAIIVGGGIIGAACGYFLQRAGFAIRLVEPGPIGGGTTAAGMGHVVLMDAPEAELALTLRSRTLWSILKLELSQSCECIDPGTIWLARDQDEMREAESKFARLTARGLPAELLSQDQLVRVEPNLSKDLVGGLLVAKDLIVRPRQAAEWLFARAGVVGANHIHAAVVKLSPGTVTLTDGSMLQADIVVNAAGLAARSLVSVPLRARKGHLGLTASCSASVYHQLVELGYIESAHDNSIESVAFNVQPQKSGQLIVGSSRQFDIETSGVDCHVLSKMLKRAAEFLPMLSAVSFERFWTGVRAATPDSLPIIGEVPDMPGVFVAAGHEGLGITTSLATGELIAALATGAVPAIDPAPFSVKRFLPASKGRT